MGKARRVALGATAVVALGVALALAPANAVVINDGYTPDQAVDTTNITGVGQMVTDQGGGFVGLCTATLINPRTVILAAHCVNEAPAGSYGAAHGGTAIGVGFQADNFDSIGDWFRSGFQTNKGNYFYNGSYVVYNQHSLDLGPDNNFFQGDVAMIGLDTPVSSTVPTHDLLFSPLSGATHATITGYGDYGTGTTGQQDLDFKRRVAENIVSTLASLNDVDGTLFGVDAGLPQNLYLIDFNDPKYGTAGASPYDFDIFNDVALQHEGITAPGDSGGPLIIDQAFSKPVIAGVLSGGSRYFRGQPSASYGTTSFYQPLYLFWDWIIANNPYKYVSAKAGDGSWTDPTHWVINLDPVYQVIGADGNLVNGLPTTPAAGINGTDPKFGNVCFNDDCVDIATGIETTGNVPSNPDTTTAKSGTAVTSSNDKGIAKLVGDALQAGASKPDGMMSSAQDGKPETMINVAQADDDVPTMTDEATAAGAPPAEGSAMVGGELVQGAPGSSNFVPNDTDGDVTTGAPARYYDVTLSADGTTTLSGADIIVDRLTISGANAGLTIDADAGLASLIDTTQYAGTMTVDGQYVSIGDYYLMGGLLQGKGTVIAPDVISAMGAIAPGRLGTIGTLTFAGNLLLTTDPTGKGLGSRTYMDIGPNGTSDKIVIVANPFIDPEAENALTGVGALGGILAISPVAGYRPTYGDKFTLITAENGLQGKFAAATSFSAILYPAITQTADALSITIKARPYSSVINGASTIQRGYATLLDRSRDGAGTLLKDFYAQTDMIGDAAQIQATLEQAGPYAQQTEVGLVRMQDEALAKFYRGRLSMLRNGGDDSGKLAVIGNPLGVVRTGYNTAQDVAMGLMQAPTGPQQTSVALPEGVGAYLAGGYLDGNSRPLPNLISGKKDDLSGWYVAGGIEKQLDDRTGVGLSASYSHGKGDTLFGGRAQSNLFQLAAYGSYRFGGGAFLNTSISGGLINIKTRRQFGLGDVTAKLKNEENAPIFSGEIGIGYDLKSAGFMLTPMASIRGSHLEFEGGQETGGVGSLTFAKRDFNSLQARVGGQASFAIGDVRPHIDAAFVHDFRKNGENIFAHFTEGTGAGLDYANFGAFGRDRNWGEVGGGIEIGGPQVQLGISADTVFKRQDLSYQVYRGSVTIHF